MKYIMNNFHIMKFILDFITGQCVVGGPWHHRHPVLKKSDHLIVHACSYE